MKIRLSQLTIDPSIQIRERLDEETIERYMETLDSLPPIVVFDDVALLVSDGFHRCEAARRLGRYEIEAEVRKGGRNEAEEYAILANTRHGRPLTRAERNEGIKRLLLHGWTPHRIVSEMGVAERTTRDIAGSLALRGQVAPPERRGTRGPTPDPIKPLPPEIVKHLDDTKLYRIASLPEEHREPVARIAVERGLSEPQVRDVIRQVKAGQPIRVPEREPDQPDEAVRRVIAEIDGFFERTMRWNGRDITFREVIRIAIENPTALQLRDRVAPTASLSYELGRALDNLRREASVLASPLLLAAEVTA